MGAASALRSLRLGLVFLASSLAASCAGGGSHAMPATGAASPASSSRTVQFSLTIPAKINVSRVKRLPQYVSSATLSGTLVVNGATSYVNLSSGSASCVSSSQGLTCVISAPAVIGANTAVLTLYDGSCTGVGPANGPCTGAPTGSPLSAASNFAFNVTEGQNNVTFPLILGGVVNNIVISLGTTSTAQGTPATVAVTVTAYDADSNIIVGPGGFSDAAGDTLTIDLTDSDASGATSLSPTSITAPGTSATLTYTGGALSSATIGATVSGGTITGSITPATLTIASTVTVSTFAGTGVQGDTNGPAASATFGYPYGVAADNAGNVYVLDYNNEAVREISGGVVSTLAGSGSQGFANGPDASATFHTPTDVAVDSSGNVYVADFGNNAIRKISAGTVSTLAGSGTAGFTNGAGAGASFYGPYGVAVDTAGDVYVADLNNNAIRKITPAGVVTTLAGTGAAGYTNGPGTSATFRGPYGVAVDSAGNVYVADTGNNVIREITPAGVVSTFAGTGSTGFANGPGSSATFEQPIGVAVDSVGNVYVADGGNNAIREITPAGVVSTLAGTGAAGFANGPGSAATFSDPTYLAVDGAGNVYVSDSNNYIIRKITP